MRNDCAMCSAAGLDLSWKSFAQLVLEAAYEATRYAAVENAQHGGSNVVLLKKLGGGAFGNDDEWIEAAISRAQEVMAGFDLCVVRVSRDVASLRQRGSRSSEP